MGNRVSKKVFTPDGNILSADYYIRDAQGNVMAVYKMNMDDQSQSMVYTVAERNIYGSDRLGVYAYPDTVYPAPGAPTADFTSVWRGYRKYELKNHLGNVATVVTGHKIPVQEGSSIGHFTAQIEAAYDYSPFGVTRMEFGEYRWGFQGQERDDEIFKGGSLNYKYRMHRPDLGRFFAVDPLYKEYPWNSTYAFSENRLLDAVELEGLEKDLLFYMDPSLNKYRNSRTQLELENDKRNFDRGKTLGLATGGALVVTGVSLLTPIPGDEALGAGLLLKTTSALFDVTSQMATGEDVDIVGPLLNFAPGSILLKESFDAAIDIKLDGTISTPIYSTGENVNKTYQETLIDFGVGLTTKKVSDQLPKQIVDIPIGNVVKRGVSEGVENIGSNAIKRATDEKKEE